MSMTSAAAQKLSATESRTEGILQWASFALMAGISIPHQTVFLRTWEPAATGLLDFLLWIACALFAATIDGFTILVTRSLLIRRRRRARMLARKLKPKWYEFDLKLKIGLLGSITFSFLLNWWYEQMQQQFASQAMGTLLDATTLGLPNSFFMPLVCSCGPLLIFVLPEIADALKDQSVLDEEEPQAVSDEEHQNRIRAISQQQELRRALANASSGPGLLQQARVRLGIPERKDHTQAISELAQKAMAWLANKPEMLDPNQRDQTIEQLRRYLDCNKTDAELAFIEAITLLEEQKAEKELQSLLPAEVIPAATQEVTIASDPQQNADKLDKTVLFLVRNPEATDEELAKHLNLKRPASARFWRLKAIEIINMNKRPRTTDPQLQSVVLS